MFRPAGKPHKTEGYGMVYERYILLLGQNHVF